MNHAERVTAPTHWVCDSLAAVRGGADVTGSEQFAGCAIVISHDRRFLARVATHILAFEDESEVTFFDGSAQAGGLRARRGLTSVGQRQRRCGWAVPIAPTTRGHRSRTLSEYEEWRKQQLGDVAAQPRSLPSTKLTRGGRCDSDTSCHSRKTWSALSMKGWAEQ
jgi:hypothetical protein